MFCTKCGSQIKPGNKFCVKCGAPAYALQQEALKPEEQQETLKPEQQETAPQAATEPSKPIAQAAGVAPQQEAKSGKGLIIALIVVLVVVVLGGSGAVAYLLWERNSTYTDTRDRNDDDDDDDGGDDDGIEGTEDVGTATEGTEDDGASTELEETTIVIDSASVQEAVWAYQEYVQSAGLNEAGFSYAFVNIDADCIPELFCDSGITAGGMLLLSYYDGTVYENWLSIGGFYYVEYQNRIWHSYGRMDVYGDSICHLQEGVLLEDASGWYGLEDNSVPYDSDGNAIPYQYFWGDEEVTEEQYSHRLCVEFDSSAATEYTMVNSFEQAFSSYVSGVPELEYVVLGDVDMQTDDILPTSSIEYLDKADVAFLTDEELRLARNEIYARHGYIFKDEELSAYFMAKDWYVPTTTEVTDAELNEYEIANRDLIKEIESTR